MGQFSWFTQDDHTQIEDDADADIYMVDPRDGTLYKESHYEGYGVFGGRDYYELMADINKNIVLRMNDYRKEKYAGIFSKSFTKLTDDELQVKRNAGIDLWFCYIEPDQLSKYAMKLGPRDKVICPILVRDPKKWKKLKGSHPDSDPDQGWA